MGSPALLAAQSTAALTLLNELAYWHRNHTRGGTISDGGTTQGSGAGTAPNVDIDTAEVRDAVIGGTQLELDAQTDVDSDAGDQVSWGATSGVEAVGLVCLSLGSGGSTPQFEIVFGDVASTSDGADAPSDDDIDDQLGHSNWVKHASFLLTRTGNTTITVTEIDHTVRPSVDLDQLKTTEAEWANGDVTRVDPIVTDPPPTA